MKKQLPISDNDFAARSTAVLKELGAESDRGLVLIAAAVLEENLELLLRSVMRSDQKTELEVLPTLFRSDGPLGTFAGKTRICYAMELIDETTYRDLTTIRSIRNDFAHSYLEAKLARDSVRDRIMSLETGKRFEEFFEKNSDVYFQMDVNGEKTIPVAVEKRRFLISTIILASILEGAARAFRDRRDVRYAPSSSKP